MKADQDLSLFLTNTDFGAIEYGAFQLNADFRGVAVRSVADQYALRQLLGEFADLFGAGRRRVRGAVWRLRQGGGQALQYLIAHALQGRVPGLLVFSIAWLRDDISAIVRIGCVLRPSAIAEGLG